MADLFDAVVARKLSGGGGGGGGSSDFSTAQVTFINNRNAIEQVMCPLANDRKRPCAYTSFYVDPGEPVTITVILYKGAAVFEAEGSYSATGNISEYGEIYGDGTVTLSA